MAGISGFLRDMYMPPQRGRHAKGSDVTPETDKKREKARRAARKRQKEARRVNRGLRRTHAGHYTRKGR